MQAAHALPLASAVPGRDGASDAEVPVDDPDRFGRPLPDASGRWESYLAIEGMYCPACTLAIEQCLAPLPGVHEVQVSGATATARVVWSPERGEPAQWLRALRLAGYAGAPAGDQLAEAPRRREQRMLLWRWLVAGFCMMQVMMYAWPAYVAEPGDLAPDVAALLRWASWLLTLPVVLFSCQPFFASAWRDLRALRIGMDVPVALGIAIAFGASTAASWSAQEAAGEVWYDSVTMFVFFLLSGRLLEQRLRDRTAGALQGLLRRLPQRAERLRPDGATEQVAVHRLAAGDRVRVRAGESFPADGRVLEGETEVDEALLTGESTPAPRGPGAAVIAGSHNLVGSVVVQVERVGADTQYAQIAALMERASVDKPRLARLADRIASPFLLAVLLAAAGAAWWWWPQGADHAIGVAVAVLIVTCPCALALATPAATLATAGALARRGILVRRPEALEAAAGVDTVVFDKTGTLTTDRMTVVATRVRPGVEPAQALAWAAALGRHSLHPGSRAVAAAAGELAAGWRTTDVRERAGQGVEGGVACDGGAARVLRLGSAAFCSAAPVAGDGAQVHLADGAGWLASFDLDETLRPDAAGSVAALHRAGARLRVLSGDRQAAVHRLAGRAGIADAWGDRTPQDKLDTVRALQASGHRVAMVGDGLNDGPVLAQADVSVAMGQAVPVAQARCDFIVPGGQLGALPLLLRQARRTRAVIRQNLAWSAGYNAVCVPLAVLGWMPPWLAGLGMAASSLVVVINAARLARLPEAS